MTDWSEVIEKRIRTGKHFRQQGTSKRLFQSVINTPLHYASQPDSIDWDNTVDMRESQVDHSDLDGFQVDHSDFHFHLGHLKNNKADNGWFSIAGRQGQAAIGMRLHRAGMTNWGNKVFTNIIANPNYNMSNITRRNGVLTLGPSGFEENVYGSNIFEWSDIWNGVTLRWVIDGRKVKTEVIFDPSARKSIIPRGRSKTDYFSLIFQLDTGGLLGKSGIAKFRQDGNEKRLRDGFDDENNQIIRLEDDNDNLLGIMPLDKAYSDKYVIADDQYLEQDEVSLTKRLYERNGKTYLMVGASLADLNAMHAGSITFDPTFEDQPDSTDGEDNFLDGDNTTTNRSTSVRIRTDAGERHGVIRFDASSISDSATCDSATLSLWSEDSKSTKAYDVYSLDSGVSDWTEGDSTWTNYKSGTAWPGSGGASTSGTDYEATSFGTIAYPVSSADTEATVSLTASRIEGWFGGTNTNYGLLVGVTGNTTSGRDWHSSGASTAGFRPQISIEYTEGGAATIALSAITLSSSAPSLSVVPGEVSIALGETTIASSAVALSVVPGAISVLLSSVSLALSAETLTAVPGAIAVLLSSASLASSAEGLSVSAAAGAQTVGLNALSLALTAESINVSPGAVSLALASLTLASSSASLLVSPGSVSLALSALTLSSSAESLSIIPGAISVLLDELSLASSSEALTVSPGAISALLSSVTLASTAESLTVIPGAVSILLSEISLASSAESLSASIGAIVALSTLSLASSAEALSVLPGAVSLALGEINLASSAEALTVAPGAIAIALSELSLASSAEALSIIPGAIAVLLNSASLASSAESISIVPGAVSILLGSISLASSAEALSVASGLAGQIVALNALSLASSAESITVIPGAIQVLLNSISLASSAPSLSVSDGSLLAAIIALTLQTKDFDFTVQEKGFDFTVRQK